MLVGTTSSENSIVPSKIGFLVFLDHIKFLGCAAILAAAQPLKIVFFYACLPLCWLLQPFQHNSKTVGPRKLKFRIYKDLVISLIVFQLKRAWHTSRVLPLFFSTIRVPLVVKG